MSRKTAALTIGSAILIVSVFFFDRIPQDPAYHLFADSRTLAGVPNFWNVASNLPFLLVGGAGVWFCRRASRPGMLPELHLAYLVFFTGILLTGLGSAYYHYAPSDETLVWDRLSMTIGFMGLFTIIIGEHISGRAASGMLAPLLIVGAASVVYWGVTEARGAGDLRPYVVVQFLPMLLIPVVLLLYRSVFDGVYFLWIVVVLYALSKVFEYFDSAVFDLGGLISGHSVKHIVAALAPLALLCGFNKRRMMQQGVAGA